MVKNLRSQQHCKLQAKQQGRDHVAPTTTGTQSKPQAQQNQAHYGTTKHQTRKLLTTQCGGMSFFSPGLSCLPSFLLGSFLASFLSLSFSSSLLSSSSVRPIAKRESVRQRHTEIERGRGTEGDREREQTRARHEVLLQVSEHGQQR